jgi:hypothetical protein
VEKEFSGPAFLGDEAEAAGVVQFLYAAAISMRHSITPY